MSWRPFNIPIPIINLFLLYYFESDNWDKKCIWPGLKIGDNNCLKHEGEEYCSLTAFLQRKVGGNSNMIHCWKFKIKHVWIDSKDDDTWTTTIGLFPVSGNLEPEYVTDDAFAIHAGFGFGVQMGRLVEFEGLDDYKKYGKRCEKDDIIKMIVDFEKEKR